MQGETRSYVRYEQKNDDIAWVEKFEISFDRKRSQARTTVTSCQEQYMCVKYI